jgi:Immunoglobulin I-set domain.
VAPKIDRRNLAKKEIRRGQMLQFYANVQGEPPPKITWAYKGAQIFSNER